MKWLVKSMLLLMVCLLLPCAGMGAMIEGATPIKGADTFDAATLFGGSKYGQVWKDELGNINTRFYLLRAPADGTYYIRVNSYEVNSFHNKYVGVRSWNNKYKYVVSNLTFKDERTVSFNAKKDEEFVLEVGIGMGRSQVREFCFSVCFDGFHAPSAESEVAHYATCSAEGEIIYPCTLCGQPGKVESIPKLPHTLGDWQKERNPGCTTTGLNVQRCTVCSEIVNQQEIPAVGHGSSKQIVTKPATCLETGVMSEQCTICLETLSTQTLSMTDHTPGIMKTVQPASCTMNGRGEQRCTVCNALLKEETTSAYGHNYSEWEVIVEATKQSEGQQMRYCYTCANVEYEKIEKLPKFLGIF